MLDHILIQHAKGLKYYQLTYINSLKMCFGKAAGFQSYQTMQISMQNTQNSTAHAQDITLQYLHFLHDLHFTIFRQKWRIFIPDIYWLKHSCISI